MRAQGELLHFLTGAAPFELGQEGMVFSSEVETDGFVTWLGPSVVDDDMNSLCGVLLHQLRTFYDQIAWRDKDLDAEAVLHLCIFCA